MPPQNDLSPLQDSPEAASCSDPAVLSTSEAHRGAENEAGGSSKPKTISCTQCRKRKLKCDRVKPHCGTCARLQHECVYPEGRKKSSMKRRNVKDLEARLAQVETMLHNEVSSKNSAGMENVNAGAEAQGMGDDDYVDDFDVEMGFGNETEPGLANTPSIPMPSMEQMFDQQAFTTELIGFGVQEQLPSKDIIDELHQIYFQRIYPSVPLLHKYRYLATVELPPPLGPPMCLRYAVWAVAAATSDKYTSLQEVFYQRSRKYLELDEMKLNGEHFTTVAHAQTWALVSNYEAQNMYLSRAWVSTGRCVRMVQMMNLHRLDTDEGDGVKQMIPPSRDWMELEERRRTFWAAFCCDRYSCAGSGWPMAIDERDITTNLPASEEAFAEGRMEKTSSLAEAMTGEGASKISPYAGVALMACLFGHNWIHVQRPGPNDHPEDVINGEFWKRHRKMDNVLSNTFMFLPEQLRLPSGIRDPNIVYLNMNIHSSTICLHQAAAMKAERHNLDPKIIKHSYNRCRVAAEEIVNIMRLISHLDVAEMNSWTAFNLYVATGVLIEGCGNPETSLESRSNLEFLLTALQAIGKKHIVTQSFIEQLRVDLDNAGIKTSLSETSTPILPVQGMTCGSPSIYFRNGNTRKVDLSVEFFSQGVWSSSRGSSSIAGGTESSSTSYKEAATPPIDPNTFSSTLQGGGLPRKNMNIRLRVSPDDSEVGNVNPPESGGFGFQNIPQTDSRAAPSRIPSSFTMPQVFAQYKLPGSDLRDTSDQSSSASGNSRNPASEVGMAYRQQNYVQPQSSSIRIGVNELPKEMDPSAQGNAQADGNVYFNTANDISGPWGDSNWTFAQPGDFLDPMAEEDMSFFTRPNGGGGV